MYINSREALTIAEALHNPKAQACVVAGKVWPITTTMGKDRELRQACPYSISHALLFLYSIFLCCLILFLMHFCC
jgi:hypothetical protein